MQIDLQKRIALVTGASRGIGKAIATKLAESGAYVVGTATTDIGAETISSYLDDKGIGMVLDVSKAKSIETFFDNCQQKKFDILVNNAGITRDNLLLRMNDDEWTQVIDTNLTSVYRMIKGVLRGMMKSRYGRIINISSVVAYSGNPGQVNYTASKAGVDSITKTLAKELGSRNILVNSVAPGFIETDMTESLSASHKEILSGTIPLNRLGKPEDVAHCVVFLCSNLADYITGNTIHVNGGMI